MARLIVVALLLVASCAGPRQPAPAPPDDVVEDPNCPSPKPTADAVCMQDCGPPVVRDGEPPPPWRWLSPEEVAARQLHGCPRCLPAGARIATPTGDVAVSALVAGALVWSLDGDGGRVAVPVVRVSSTPVPRGHALVVLELSDGRTVAASAEHPTADGRLVGALAAGAALDGARVVAIGRQAYAGDRTWDLLPAGPTGAYWADGVLLGSTLARP